MAISRRRDTLAFTQGKIIYLKDIMSMTTGVDSKLVEIKRDCNLCAVAVSDDGLSVAAGDTTGKIYYVTNPKGSTSLIVQTFHWHAQAVNHLEFIHNAPLLMSGGNEAVLVQWHLEKQEKTFVSRVGNAIVNFSLSHNFYSMILADNTLKVVRTDNNKTVLQKRVLHLEYDSQIDSIDKKLVVPSGT